MKLVIGSVARQRRKGWFTKETVKNSTTPVSIPMEVWIMSGLLLSLAQQIAGVSLHIRLEDLQDINKKEEL